MEDCLTIEKWRALKDSFRSLPPPVIAYVVKPHLEQYVRGIIAWTRSENPILDCSPEVYTDLQQTDDILAFEDRLSLHCYLIRHRLGRNCNANIKCTVLIRRTTIRKCLSPWCCWYLPIQ